MNQASLFTVGLPFGRWPQWLAEQWSGPTGAIPLDEAVSRWHDTFLKLPELQLASTPMAAPVSIDASAVANLFAQRPADLECWGGADERLCWTAEAIARADAQARFFVLVESPSDVLAHWLAQDSQNEERGAPALVASAARALAQFVQRHPDRCLVVDLDEAAAYPQGFGSTLSQWGGHATSAAPAPAPGGLSAPAALEAVLAEHLVASIGGLAQIQERLSASCRPLSEEVADVVRASCDPLEAIAQHRALRRKAASLHTAERQLEAALLAQTKSTSEMERARREHDELKSRLAAAETRLGAMQKAQDSSSSEALRRCERESELLLVQLHQVQEELEHYYLEWQRSSRETAKTAAPAALPDTTDHPVLAERIDLAPAFEVAPHRHLPITLHGVAAAGRTLPRIEMRLVEHLGHPGIALFAVPGMPTPLMAWEPTGTEGERSFVLLVPADDPSRKRLSQLGTTDWRLVSGLAEMLSSALPAQAPSGASLARWRNVALRLSAQLADLPQRFRFDRVEIESTADAGGAWQVVFGGASFGAAHAESLGVMWHARAASDGEPIIELLAPEAGARPLVESWPVSDEGQWLPRWRVPLAGSSNTELASAWRSFTHHDRGLLLGLVDALPAALPAAVARGLVTEAGAPTIRRAAAAALRRARNLALGSRLRRAALALRGRTLR